VKVLLANSERRLRGGELQTLSLAAGLEGLGCEVLIVARTGSALAVEASGRSRCETVRFEAIPVLSPPALAALMARWRPDILHAQTSTAHTHLWVARGLLRGAPPLVVSRRVAFPVHADPLSYLKYRTGVAHYLPISEAAAASLGAIGVQRSRMTIVPSGVDVARFSVAGGDRTLLERWGIGEEDFVVGTVGAFEREKGHEMLIEAASIVIGKHPRVRFVLVGEGRLKESLERAASERGLAGKVVLTKQSAPLERILPLFRVFVLPSLSEGLSTAILAALAAGLPVVASDVGGIPEAVTPECGILVPPRDPALLAQSVVRLVEDDLTRLRLSEGARRRAARFDMAATVYKTMSVYRSVIEGLGGARES
jgi:glycosyltransferase involved in cell wall biosynthesis